MRNLILTAPNMPKIRTYEKLQLGCLDRSTDRQQCYIVWAHIFQATIPIRPWAISFILSFHFHWWCCAEYVIFCMHGNKQMCHWKWSTDRSIGRYSTKSKSRMSIFLIWSMANFMHSVYSRLISINAGLRKSSGDTGTGDPKRHLKCNNNLLHIYAHKFILLLYIHVEIN